jgi:hypothetical protein
MTRRLAINRLSNNVGAVKHLFEHTPACTQRGAPFRSRGKSAIQPRLARNRFSGRELSPTHASLRSTTSIMPLRREIAIELLRLLPVLQSQLVRLSRFCIHPCNFLKARMVICSYNHHLRLLSPEPFGWFAPPKLTRVWEPTLLWNQLHSLTSFWCKRTPSLT